MPAASWGPSATHHHHMSAAWALATEPIRLFDRHTVHKALPGSRSSGDVRRRVQLSSVLVPAFHGSQCSATFAVQYLQNSTCGAARCPESQSTEGARPLRGHFFASKDMTALCMRRANHEIAAGPQQPKEDRLKVLGNPDARRQKPMLEPQRQKCEQSMLLPSLFGCPPFRQHRQPSSLEPRGRASRLCGCQRSCSSSSELRRQTSGCFLQK